MVHGFKGEAKIVAGWEKKYKTRISSVAQNHVRALKAVKAKSFVGATYFPDKLNKIFAKYFEDAGFKVRSMAGIDVPFNKAQELSGEQIYAHIKKSFLKAKGADAIYMLGSGWRTLKIIDLLEQDLQVPVVHPVTARVWEFQKWLNVREPRSGFGCMLRDSAISDESRANERHRERRAMKRSHFRHIDRDRSVSARDWRP